MKLSINAGMLGGMKIAYFEGCIERAGVVTMLPFSPSLVEAMRSLAIRANLPYTWNNNSIEVGYAVEEG